VPLAMVALVPCHNVKFFREPQHDVMPVVHRTKKSVDYNNRPALPEFFETKLHEVVIGFGNKLFSVF
jgi:hypothetical protein